MSIKNGAPVKWMNKFPAPAKTGISFIVFRSDLSVAAKSVIGSNVLEGGVGVSRVFKVSHFQWRHSCRVFHCREGSCPGRRATSVDILHGKSGDRGSSWRTSSLGSILNIHRLVSRVARRWRPGESWFCWLPSVSWRKCAILSALRTWKTTFSSK